MPDLAAGVGVKLTKEDPNVLRISTDVVSGRSAFATWADLAAHPGTAAGQVAEVPTSDAATHTDPVVGGTVNNSGVFRWSAAPAGWQRIASVDALSASGFADNAAASAAAAAASAASLSPMVGRIANDAPPGWLEVFTDENGRIAGGITDQGVLQFASLQALRSFALGSAGEVLVSSAPGVLLGAQDHDGNLPFFVGEDGATHMGAAKAGSLNGTSAGSIARLLGEAPLILGSATRYIIPAYGQSLALGTGATADPVTDSGAIALTTDQPYGNKMFHGGVRPNDINGFASSVYDSSSLVPHIEGALGGTGGYGETICGGFQAMLFQLLNAYGVSPANSPFHTISFADGQGATAIAAFRSGSGLFTRYMGFVTAAHSLATGQNVQMPGQFWLQGESGQSDDGYIAQLVAYAAEVDSAARAILTAQSDPVVTFTYQMDVALMAHMYVEAQKQSPLVRVVAPMYPVQIAGQRGVNYDEVHRSAPGYRHYGATAAVAWFCHVILKRPWRPLQLSYNARGNLRCRVDGSDLILFYDVPHGGTLAFDVGNWSGSWARPQRGFYLFNSGGTEKVLSDVRLEGRNGVRLAGAAPVAGDILRIGYKDATVTSPRSVAVNLRDCQGDVITFDDGAKIPIHNWALGEQHILTSTELS
jgi:hypothetical protein